MAGISLWQLLIILAIVVMLFGTKRLRSIGTDLGEAIKGFKKSVNDEDTKPEETRSLEADDATDETGSKQDDKSETRH